AIAAVAGNALAGAEARLVGKVTDAATKGPIPDVTINVVSTGARNFKSDFKGDKKGEYHILLVDGTLPYQVTWSAPGYQSYQEQMKLKLGDKTDKDVALTPVAAVQPAAMTKPNPAVAAYNDAAQLFNDGK